MEFELCSEMGYKVKHPNPRDGDLRAWWNTNGHNKFIKVGNISEAKKLIRKMTNEQVDDESIGFNACGLEQYQDWGEGWQWGEYYNEYGEDIEGIMAKEGD